MKYTVKKLLAVVLALVLVVGLTACGGDTPKTPAEILAKAEENLEAVKSMTFDMSIEMGMAAEGQTLDMAITMTGESITDPAVMHATMGLDMGMLGAMEMEMYAEEADGKAITYMGMDNGAGIEWGKEEAPIEDSAEFDAQGGMSEYMALAMDMTENGTETVNGAEATRYDGVISKEHLEEALEATGMMDSMSDLMGVGDEETIEESMAALTDLADMPISIWVDKEQMLPVKYEMDMTELMQKVMSNMMGNMGEDAGSISISTMKISMTLGGFNSVETIEIPEEAKNAASMS